MSRSLEGLSPASMMEARKAAEMYPEGLRCPMLPDYPISPLACKTRRTQFLDSNRTRRRLCAGQECSHWTEEAHPAAPAAEDIAKEAKMKAKEAKAAKADRLPAEEKAHPLPLPEGYRINGRGHVVDKHGLHQRICPQCGERWINKKNDSCVKCYTEKRRRGEARPWGMAAVAALRMAEGSLPAHAGCYVPDPDGGPPLYDGGAKGAPGPARPPSDAEMAAAIRHETDDLADLLYRIYLRAAERARRVAR